jgi:hypothetical protein
LIVAVLQGFREFDARQMLQAASWVLPFPAAANVFLLNASDHATMAIMKEMIVSTVVEMRRT